MDSTGISLLAFVGLISCDSVDPKDEIEPKIIDVSESLFPLVVGNYWLYERKVLYEHGSIRVDTMWVTVAAGTIVLVDSVETALFRVLYQPGTEWLLEEEDDGVIWYVENRGSPCGFGWGRQIWIPTDPAATGSWLVLVDFIRRGDTGWKHLETTL